MNYLPFLIAKHFYYSKKQPFSAVFIALISKIGITISIFALLISCSALNGFHIQLNKKILSSFPHGIITLKNPSEKTRKDIKYNIKHTPEIFDANFSILINGLLQKNNIRKLVQIKGLYNTEYLKKYFLLEHAKKNLYKKKIILLYRLI